MSLYKQLWLGIIFLLTLVFCGSLLVSSLSEKAYLEQQLYMINADNAMALVFLIAMILAGILGSYLLKRILRPLDDVIEQAEAIGQRRFITTPEPYTKEFQQVVAAMNKLSGRIKHMLKQEAKRLEKWQRDAHIDKVTGLLNREPFMQALDAVLQSDDVNSTGSLGLIRISGLARLNENFGRKAIDSMLRDVGSVLNRIVMQHSHWAASRLNGSDFVLLAPRAMEPGEAALEAQAAIREILQNRSMPEDLELPGAATLFTHGDSFGALMTRLDGALLAADYDGQSSINIAHQGDIPLKSVRDQMEDWRTIFASAFREKKFRLGAFPVVGLENNLLHYESTARLEWQGNILAAGQFLPWINRLELSYELDMEVVRLAVQTIEAKGRPICVNLSVASVVEPSFLSWISEKLSSHAEAASKLWLEVSEPTAFRHLDNFKLLCTKVKAYGCKVGIEHMGHQLAELGQLHDAGVDYFKIDASFVRDIDSNTGNQTLLRTLCTVGHSIGVAVIAEGVRSAEEWAMLQELGADGATGPGIGDPQESA